MNEIVNKFLLAGDKFILEIPLRQPGFFMVLGDHLQKAKKESKNLSKQEIQVIFIKKNDIKLVSNMTWLMKILEI